MSYKYPFSTAKKIFVSNSYCSLPESAVEVSIDLIDPAILDIMCAHHSPISYSTIAKSGLWVNEHSVYCSMPMVEGDNRYYRVMISYM
jgi:hypothetical protein